MTTQTETTCARIAHRELKQAITGLGKIIKGSRLPVLRHVLISVRDGRMTMSATDLEQTAVYSFAGPDIEGRGQALVQFKDLRELTKVKTSELIFRILDDRAEVVFEVAGQTVSRDYPVMDIEEWPRLDLPETSLAEAPDFLATYRRVSVFASKDPTREILNGVCVEPGESDGRMIATDGRRLTCCNSMSIPLACDPLVLGCSRFLNWSALGDDCLIGTGKVEGRQVVQIRAGQWSYWTAAVDGTFPNWKQVIPCEGAANGLRFAEPDIPVLLESIRSFPGEGLLILSGTDTGKIEIKATDPKSGRKQRLVLPNSEFSGDASTGVDRAFLADALRSGFETFGFSDELSPLRADDGKGGLHVLMPMRFDASTEPENKTSINASKTEGTAIDSEASAKTPEPKPTPIREEKQMENKEPNTIERLSNAAAQARLKVRDANSALTELTSAIKALGREQQREHRELEQARRTLAKLQDLPDLMRYNTAIVQLPLVREASGDPIRSPEEVSVLCRDMAELAQECFITLLLNTRNRLIDRQMVSLGVADSALVHPREVFRPAIQLGAASVVLVHNHPSGDPSPSAEDIRITRQLVEAGRLIDIRVADHVVIGRPDTDRPGFISMREAGVCDFA